MRVPRIYTPQELTTGQELLLEPQASQHLSRVLRLGEGEAVQLFNGNGKAYVATIATVQKKQLTLQVVEAQEAGSESPLHIHLGIAMSRGERMDLVVQKATELGVATITPLITERTGVKLNKERAEKKIRHWQQVIISACEQCGRNHLPQLHKPTALDDWLATANGERKFVLHHRSGQSASDNTTPASVDLLIGPEGGLSEAEIQQSEANGFVSMRLGPRVLRTETAPLAALAILQARWGIWGPCSNSDPDYSLILNSGIPHRCRREARHRPYRRS